MKAPSALRRLLLVLVAAGLTERARAQLPTVEPRNTAVLGDSATDQHGQPFTVTGLSGLVHLGGSAFLAVMDGSDKLVELDVPIADDGSILTATITGGFTLAEARDFEGIALPSPGSVLLAEEGTPAVREYDLSGGAALAVLPTPAVYANLRPNRGFESLARSCDGASLWTANEEALTVDGPPATPTNGTTVRILRYDAAGAPAEQLAYEVEPMHGPYLPGPTGQSGLSELLALPDGSLLALERSLALASPLYLSRLYLVDPTGATDVSALPALDGAVYTPVAKHLLWSGGLTNLEGLSLGRALPNGAWSVLGIVDDGDPLSQNLLAAFVVSDLAPGGCLCGWTAYCTAAPNSAGPGARIAAEGSTSVAANDLVLTVSGAAPGQPGLFYYGPDEARVPFGDGFRCVGGGSFRLGPPVMIDGAGETSRPLDLTAPPADAGPGAITAGTSWSFQLWYRDPAGAGGSGFNLSDGLRVGFCR